MTYQREIDIDIIKITKDQTYSGAVLEGSRGGQQQHYSHEHNLDIGCVSGVALPSRIFSLSCLLEKVACLKKDTLNEL